MFTGEEGQAIVYAAVAAHPGGCDEAALDRVTDWAERVRVEGAILQLVMDGELAVMVDESGEASVMGMEYALKAVREARTA